MTLTYFCELERAGGGTAASAPGDVNEERAKGTGHTLEAGLEIGETDLGLRGKEFEGEVIGGGRECSDLIGDFLHGEFSRSVSSIRM